MMEYQKLRKELYPSDEEEEASMEEDEKSQENGCEDKKMRDMEQASDTTGVNNGDVVSAAMNEDVDEEKEDERMSDNEISEEDEEEDSYHTMGDENRSSNKYSSEYTDAEETSEPIVVQETHKYQVKFETKTLGMDVAKGRNSIWVTKVNMKKLKKKI